MPSTSAWNCISQSLAAAPPSTRSAGTVRPIVVLIASKSSALLYAMASSAARARWAREVPRVRPVIVPRASGSQYGVPMPTNAGTK